LFCSICISVHKFSFIHARYFPLSSFFHSKFLNYSQKRLFITHKIRRTFWSLE
jgi:hypothetical protein